MRDVDDHLFHRLGPHPQRTAYPTANSTEDEGDCVVIPSDLPLACTSIGGRDVFIQLPTELLLSIFAFALADDAPRHITRLRLTHVCALWRGTVIYYAQFWSRLSLRPAESVRDRIMMTRLDFERALICPQLDVTIASETRRGLATGTHHEQRMAVVQKEREELVAYIAGALNADVRSRLQILRFGPVSRSLLDLIETHWSFPTTLNQLKEIYFEPGWFASAYLQTRARHLISNIITSQSSLQVVQLTSFTIPNLFPATLRKMQLRAMNLDNSNNLYSMLRPLQHLEELVLLDRLPDSGLLSSGTNRSAMDKISLPELHTLALIPLDDNQDAVFLQQLDCPKLRALHLDDTKNQEHQEWPRINHSPITNTLAAIDQHIWNLEEIKFEGITQQEKLTPFLLKRANGIRRLSISVETYAALRGMTSTMPFPALEEIAFPLSEDEVKRALGLQSTQNEITDQEVRNVEFLGQIKSPYSTFRIHRLGVELRELLGSTAGEVDDATKLLSDSDGRAKSGRRVYLCGAGTLGYRPAVKFRPLCTERAELVLPCANWYEEVYVGEPHWTYV
ncbi:hypothetical protein CALCODRAFT_503843 [Calocera cornea HHB12733]|uniref:Uncharacterized protein n=1 Tax=Calocera cornea HHB12733 TaxID=1353952 RepID=A0A165CQ99_9BASI|nr:hypothetical protein CALCODRAFT_503843 [Calocera cornea HHB12733]